MARVFFGGLLVIGLAAAATLALVSRGSDDGWDKPLPNHGPLDGRSLVATRIVGHAVPAGTQVNLSFAGGRFSADGGTCNDIDGGYRLRHSRLQTLQVTQSLVGCGEEPVLDWIADVLSDAEVTLSGDRLTLRSGDTVVAFDPRLDRESPSAIVGKRWALTAITEDGRRTAVAYHRPIAGGPSISLDDRTGTLLTPCALVGLAVRPAGHRLILSRADATPIRNVLDPRGCTGRRARIDAAMRRALDSDLTARRAGHRLTMGNATTVLRFRLHRVSSR